MKDVGRGEFKFVCVRVCVYKKKSCNGEKKLNKRKNSVFILNKSKKQNKIYLNT